MFEPGSALGLLAVGIALGMRHALEADHVAAVAALATRTRTLRETVWQGVVWGAGHTIALLAFGGVVLALHASVPQRLAAALEFTVGVMLVGLGIDVARRLVRERVHFHVHRHGDGTVHLHAHSHAGDPHPHGPLAHRHAHVRDFPMRALLVGLMHGMAGTAAIVVLSAGAAGKVVLGLAQIACFGAGSILGMALLSVAIAVPLRWSAPRASGLRTALHAAVGLASIAFGAALMIESAKAL